MGATQAKAMPHSSSEGLIAMRDTESAALALSMES
jgi:hypothetical protein